MKDKFKTRLSIWNKEVLNGLMTSNVPREIMEYNLLRILHASEKIFLKESKQWGLI